MYDARPFVAIRSITIDHGDSSSGESDNEDPILNVNMAGRSSDDDSDDEGGRRSKPSGSKVEHYRMTTNATLWFNRFQLYLTSHEIKERLWGTHLLLHIDDTMLNQTLTSIHKMPDESHVEHFVRVTNTFFELTRRSEVELVNLRHKLMDIMRRADESMEEFLQRFYIAFTEAYPHTPFNEVGYQMMIKAQPEDIRRMMLEWVWVPNFRRGDMVPHHVMHGQRIIGTWADLVSSL